jgi:hypothetical protein
VHTDKLADYELQEKGYGYGGIEADAANYPARYGPRGQAFLRRIYEEGHALTSEQRRNYLKTLRSEPTQISRPLREYSINAIMPRVRIVAEEFQRWLKCTHQGGGAIAEEHLDSYLDEFTFRFNFRVENRPGMLFHRLLKIAVATQPTP